MVASRWFIAPLLVGSAAPALAQEIVVTGRGLGEAPAARALETVELGRDRIEANAARRLESLLGEVAGLQQFRRSDSRSANPTSQGLTLRGLGGNAASRALLVLDGVPQADPFGGWVAFPSYATERLGRIRVTRGGGAAFWGPGAISGLIELESATPDQLAPVEGAIAYGSRQSVDAYGSAALKRDGGFATLSASYASGDGFIPIVPERRGPVDRPAPYEQGSIALRGVIAIAPDTELQANVSAFADERERGFAFSDNKSEGADASLRLVGRGRWGFSALAYLQTRNFASSFAAVNAARTTANQTLDQYSTPATGLGGRIEVAPPFGERISLNLGADIRALDGRTQELFTFVSGAPTRRRSAGGETRTTGLFADGSLDAGPVTLTLSGRLDWWRITDGFISEVPLGPGPALRDLRFADREGTETTGRAGIVWRVAPPVALRAAAYKAWRLPTLNELYRPFRVGPDATAPNPLLAPERLTGWEVGATLTPVDGLSIAATWFDNDLDNAIANVTVANGPGVFPLVGFVSGAGSYRERQNLESIRARGIELDAAYTVGPFSARASWSHVDAEVRGAGAAAALTGLAPAQTPGDQVAGTLAWQDGARALSVSLRHIARQFEDDQNSRGLRAATTLDAYAAWPLTRALSLEARAENLFDARVEAAVSGTDLIERAIPRTLWIGLRFRPR